MSDTHGNLALMREAVAAMQRQFRAEVIFHLGDDYHDADELALSGCAVRRVPGLWCAEYIDARIPKRLVETFDGVSVSCAHADKDLRHFERAAALVMTGHTHKAAIALLGLSLYVNPGHLKAAIARNERASYAIITIGPEEVHAAIHEIVTNAVRIETTVQRERLA